MKTKENFNSFDITKFILSILIIGIHARPFYKLSNIMNTLFSNGICRMAVPIFFLISGYLLMYRLNITKNKIEYIKNYLKRLIKLYIIWTIIYLPIIITRLITNKYGLISDFMIFFRNTIFDGSVTHLWYIKDLAVAIIIICILKRLNLNDKKILAISLSLYLLGIWVDTYYGLLVSIVGKKSIITTIIRIYTKVFVTTRNGLFFGLIYVFLGMIIYNSKGQKKKINLQKYTLLFLILYIIEIFTLSYYTNMKEFNLYLFLIPLVVCIFNYIVDKKIENRKIDFKLLRNMSTLIYFSHILFLEILKLVLSNNLILFILVVILSILFSYIIIKLSNKFKFLKKIYS